MRAEEFYNTYLQYPQICTDSRKVIPGCLYFALKGERFDGNRFAAEALEKGAAIAVVDDPGIGQGDRYVLVDDVLGFLQSLAAWHRSRLKIPVIGLTGTNGKTTTKELIHSVLSSAFNTVATEGNLNNHIGVPLTILRASQSTEVLILEMGANHRGEIGYLCSVGKPDYGLITNIGKAHLEGFGSFEGVIAAKSELYDWLKESGGTLFLNDDDALLKDLAGAYPRITYGTGDQADVTGAGQPDPSGLSLKWRSRGEVNWHVTRTSLAGLYNLPNVLAAIAVGVKFGVDAAAISKSVEAYVPGNMRSQWITTSNNQVLLDAYNANPTSMAAALDNFAALKLPRSVVILGDMFELGAFARDEHLSVIRQISDLGFADAFLCGTEFRQLKNECKYPVFATVSELSDYLSENGLIGRNILLKGSRGMKMEQLLKQL